MGTQRESHGQEGKMGVGRPAPSGQAEPDSRGESSQGNARVPQEQHELPRAGGHLQETLEGTSKTVILRNGRL